MALSPIAPRLALALLVLASLTAPSGASTFIRQGLDRLAADNELILHGRVQEIRSYWDQDHSFIFTDVRVHPSQLLKGTAAGDVTFTLMGGTVGGITTLIVDGADLVPGSDYVLFLSRVELPGGERRLTVRDFAQGAFDLEHGRAFSQALGHPLLPDGEGRSEAPGGLDGLPLDELVRQVHADAGR